MELHPAFIPRALTRSLLRVDLDRHSKPSEKAGKMASVGGRSRPMLRILVGSVAVLLVLAGNAVAQDGESPGKDPAYMYALVQGD